MDLNKYEKIIQRTKERIRPASITREGHHWSIWGML